MFTHEQNILVKRLNRVLLNIHAMLDTAHLLLTLREKALNYATHLYNIIPHKALEFKTFYEFEYKTKTE